MFGPDRTIVVSNRRYLEMYEFSGEVAEGVETEEQLAQVRALGCTEMQGYLFSKARTAADLAELLAESGGRLVATPAKPVTGRSAGRRAA
jgi:predicted signal transduction protein with EAL and GGDEF domain